LNDPAIVTFDAWPGLQVDAKVISIAPKANSTANVVNFEVHLALEDSDLDLRAGMTANAVIQSFTVQDTLLAPNEAIFLDPESGYFVYLVTSDGARKTAVVIGERGDQDTQILSGVSAGDKLLITEPHTLLP
jgi:multidrug efflux pump subunit AcrA (membrane-fusion protein)